MTPHERAAKVWYEEFDGKVKSPGWIITTYGDAIVEHIDELLSDDEETIEALVKALDDWGSWRDKARAVLVALREKASS